MFRDASIYLLVSFFLVLFAGSCIAQENVVQVEQSTDKILLEGKPYYIHIVKKGQTLFSISKVYKVSQKVISKENPTVAFGLRPGQALKIPIFPEKSEPEIPGETEDFVFHEIESGQTIYFIAKKYDSTVEIVLDNNPDIKIDDIAVGTIIKIPRRKYQVMEEKYEFSEQDYIFHIPSQDSTYVIVKDTEFEEDTSDIFCASLPDISNRTLEVALLLPFYLNENSERTYIDSSEVDDYGEKIMEVINRDEKWVYPGSTYFLDFMMGVKLALDSLQKEGISVELFCFDTEADTSVVREIIETDDLAGMDLIIGPVYQYNLSIVAPYARNLRIPIVSPLSSKGSLTDSNPYLFQIVPSIDAEFEKLASYVSNYHDNNIVLIHSGDLREEDNILTLKRNLFRYFAYRTFFDDVIFKEIVYNEDFTANDIINSVEHSLSKEVENLIIVPSGQETFASEILGRLYSFSEEYSITVLGYPTWIKFRNVELKYFYGLEVQVFTPFFISYDNYMVKNFLRKYKHNFNTEPDQFSYAWKGYDIAWYFISGLSRYGDHFLQCHKEYKPQLLEAGFEFKRVNSHGGYVNNYFRMLKFTKDYKILDIKQ